MQSESKLINGVAGKTTSHVSRENDVTSGCDVTSGDLIDVTSGHVTNASSVT
jgi:hypothetical protein